MRCGDGGACLRQPHRLLCLSTHGVCPDHSDISLCSARVFTGSLLDTRGGLTIAPVTECHCQLRDGDSGAGAVYRCARSEIMKPLNVIIN